MKLVQNRKLLKEKTFSLLVHVSLVISGIMNAVSMTIEFV